MGMSGAKVVSVNLGAAVGEKKKPRESCRVLADLGLEGDGHAGTERQVSLLAVESIQKIRDRGLEVQYGDFAENLTTEGIDLPALPVGARLKVGPEAILEITRIGKECHDRCHIYYAVGDCVMPKEGVFARVVMEGTVRVGDGIEMMADGA